MMVRKMYRFRALTYSRVEPVRPVWGEGLLEGGEALYGEEDVQVGQAVRHAAQARPQVHRVQLRYTNTNSI